MVISSLYLKLNEWKQWVSGVWQDLFNGYVGIMMTKKGPKQAFI